MAALACVLSQAQEEYRSFDGMTCGNIVGEKDVASQAAAEAECPAECLKNENCGGVTWSTQVSQPRCAFISHGGMMSECRAREGFRTAARDTRVATVQLLSNTQNASMFFRCPYAMQISGVASATVGKELRWSASLAQAVVKECVSRQSCRVLLEQPSDLNECDGADCGPLRAVVNCEASPTFNEDAYFNGWSSSSWPTAREQTPRRRQEWQQSLARVPAYPNNATGRGIIVVAGGKYIEPALVLAVRLRELGFPYAIQFWHLGAAEILPEALGLLKKLRVETCDFLQHVPAELLHPIAANVGMRLFQLKPLALLHSSLREILLLDADNLPIRNPSYLFETPEYRSTGALFWPDYWTTSPSNPIWGVVQGQGDNINSKENLHEDTTSSNNNENDNNKEESNPHNNLKDEIEWEQESGQLLVDKARAWEALHLCVFINSEFYMRLLNGDKDTFRFSWKATNTPYHMIRAWPATLGIGTGTFANQTHLCGHTMLQHDPAGAPLFVHHNQMKDLVLPVGQNFKYLQRRTQACRADPRAGFAYGSKVVPCFDFVAPRMPYVEQHLLPVSRSYLETFEIRYAMARRIVQQHMGLQSGTRPRVRRDQAVMPSSSNQTFIVDGNVTEVVTECAAETVAPTNITDRKCSFPPVFAQINVTYMNATGNTSAGLAVQTSGDEESSLRPNITLFVGFTYHFVAQVPFDVGLTLTHTQGGGPTSSPIPEAAGAPANDGSTITLQPIFQLTQVYYESPLTTELGGAIIIEPADFDRLPGGQRIATAFDDRAVLFEMSSGALSQETISNDCRHRCALNPLEAHACAGVYVLQLGDMVVCRGVKWVGEPTATRLDGVSWVKVQRPWSGD